MKNNVEDNIKDVIVIGNFSELEMFYSREDFFIKKLKPFSFNPIRFIDLGELINIIVCIDINTFEFKYFKYEMKSCGVSTTGIGQADLLLEEKDIPYAEKKRSILNLL